MDMDPKMKILLLEDDPADAELIQRLLQRSGLYFNATIASNKDEFHGALEDNGFDIVLADNALPQYSSLEALNAIKERNPFIAFILVTGTVSEEFAVKIMQQGADDYILKGNLTRLPAAITKALENKKMQREKRYAEIEMYELNEQLRNLAAHLQQVREEEKTHIAREIHDELGQMLTAIKMDIALSQKKYKEVNPEAGSYLLRALEMVDDTVKAVRRIASELRPAILDDLGLVAALEWQCREFEKRNNIQCLFSSSLSNIEVEKNIAIGLYRICQEALTNVARHSRATKVTANILVQANLVVLTITDNGKGFNPEKVKGKKTLGLVGMKERALMMNGKLTAESTPGQGATITISVAV
jgi:signal transduction histidine kinase